VLGNQPAAAPWWAGGPAKAVGLGRARICGAISTCMAGRCRRRGFTRILREVEMPLIEIALDATGGNQAKCADLLGINRNTLRKKITDLDIRVTRRRKLM
jgi:two-component system nitrogen regulation response regulator GlnG